MRRILTNQNKIIIPRQKTLAIDGKICYYIKAFRTGVDLPPVAFLTDGLGGGVETPGGKVNDDLFGKSGFRENLCSDEGIFPQEYFVYCKEI